MGCLKKHKGLTITIAIVVVLVAAFAVLNSMLPGAGRIAVGVTIDGDRIGGMTLDELESKLEANDYYDNRTLVFIGEPDTEEVMGTDIGLRVDAKATAEKVYNICRDGNWFNNVKNALIIRFASMEIIPVPTADEMLDELIYNRGVRKNGEMTSITLEEVSETELLIKPAVPGQSEDVSESRKEVFAQIESGNTDAIKLELPASGAEQVTADKLYEIVYIEPVNAEYKIENRKLYITDEVVGRSADKAEIEQKLESFNAGEEITLTITKVLPEVTAASLNKELFEAELGSYTSKYSTGAANRAYNVSKAASSVNGTVLMPGEVFSYNEAIGNPSLANGYKIAPIFANGKQSEGVGGGVCQVSSTLYCAALYSNLEIVERRSHSLTVAYVPKGQDATVSYGSVDFKFKNNTDKPIKVESSATGGICKVRILGAKPTVNREVKVVNTTVSVSQPTRNETIDPSMPAGASKVTSSGKTGYVVDSVRIVTENGKEVKREKLTRSTYRMVPTEVTVGTKETETPHPTPESAPVTAESTETTEPPQSPEPTVSPTKEPTEETIVIPTEEPAEEV